MLADLDWNYLKYIDAITTTGSLSGGAKLLKIDVSTLSRNLQKLETQYHLKIFVRKGNSYQVTEAGSAWVEYARKMREGMDSLASGLNEEGKIIRLTTLEIFLNHYLISRISRFSSKLELLGSDRSYDLSKREADVAIRFALPTTRDYVVQQLFKAGHAIYVGKKFQNEMRSQKKINWVSLNESFDSIEDYQWIRENVKKESIAYHVSSCQQILSLLKAVPVAGILPCYVGDIQSDIVRLKSKEILFEREGWLVIHRDLAEAKNIRRFKDELKKAIQNDNKFLQFGN